MNNLLYVKLVCYYNIIFNTIRKWIEKNYELSNIVYRWKIVKNKFKNVDIEIIVKNLCEVISFIQITKST